MTVDMRADLSGVHVLVAPDKFKGSLTARQAAEAVAVAVRRMGGTAELLPIADGGEGTVDAFGGANRTSTVTGPLRTPVEAGWRLADGVAVIESAAACGLVLAGGAEGNDPMRATTRGAGELIAEALAAGAREVLVGMGGSASTDGGIGALEALAEHVPLPPGRVHVLTDVTTPYRDAAVVFGPQKGASPEQIALLTDRLRNAARAMRDRFGVDIWDLPRAGASGGLSGGLAAAGAELTGGAEMVADRLGLGERLERADVIVTGEGQFDATSLAGKGPGLVVAEAQRRGIPVLVVAGVVSPDVSGTCQTVSLVSTVGPDEALSDPERSVSTAAETGLRQVLAQVHDRRRG